MTEGENVEMAEPETPEREAPDSLGGHGGVDPNAACPCGRGETYGACCGPLHAGEPAPTAERLMRSRYVAFALGLVGYLERSWDATTRPANLEIDPDVEWRRLLIERVEAGSPFDREGFVTFTAIGRTPEGRFEQRERSRFVRDDARHWVYVDGEADFF